MPPAIKNVNVILSLDNCERFIESENHKTRIAKLRTDGLKYIQETSWLYHQNNT